MKTTTTRTESSAYQRRMLRALDKVRKMFGRNGEYWKQGASFSGKACCLVTACGSVRYNGGLDVLTLLREVARPRSGYLHLWNDKPGRTFADVEKLIEKARSKVLSSADAGAKP